jgi:hypothetical protein
VADEVVGEDDPSSSVHHVGQFFAKKFQVLKGGFVGTSLDGGVIV